MTDLWTTLKTTDRPIVLYGMGDGADKMLARLESIGKKPAAVFASDGFVRGQSFRGYTVIKFDDAFAAYPDMIVLVCFGSQLADVMDNVKRIAKKCTLFAPDLPVYGDGVFDINYYNSHLSDLDYIRSRLADDTSCRVFDSLVEYKLSGRIDPLISCETLPSEAYENILRLGNDEVYVDLGAYRGDTVSEFLSFVDGYKKIYAVEPDKKNFSKLYEAYGDTVCCINAAATDFVGKVPFDNKKGRNSHLSGQGSIIDATTVDSIVSDDGVSFIKFDVEGNEAAALRGCATTVARFRPRLCVAAYHRAHDLVDIPLQVLSLNPDYRVFLRHFPYIPAWDTNYYFV